MSAAHCNILQQYFCNTLQHTATHCNTFENVCSTLQHTATTSLQHTATHCNTLQHTTTRQRMSAAHCNMLQQHFCNTLQHTATHCNTLQHVRECLQHIAACCNNISATRCNTQNLCVRGPPVEEGRHFLNVSSIVTTQSIFCSDLTFENLSTCGPNRSSRQVNISQMSALY